ncbi:MAG: ABC transporter permease [Betaproteobacteria bacterium]|nr:ABC transporter permease [Betaproteobacteria bacterium]
MSRQPFSFSRWSGIIIKEFIQLRRDRLTFGMIVGIPVIQLLLFGFAINTDPKNLPTAILAADSSSWSRSLVAAMQTSGYFRITRILASAAEVEETLAHGKAQFVVTIPENFGRKLARGERPVLLVEADATDPSAVGGALSALNQLATSALARDLQGPYADARPAAPPFEIRLHRRYNPEGITAYNIVPGLLGVILTMTMVLMTGLAMTRERERGTFENLLATPALPIEVMTGKIVPYILIGLIQVSLILAAAFAIFRVPMHGSLATLYLVVLLFIAANLTLGMTFSSIAQNQLQAMQMTFFFFLPSMLLSGFMFPFSGMPGWAQAVGSVLPLTHFLVLVRGIMLKGNALHELWPAVWPILVFMLAVIGVGLRFYKRTLD